MVEYIWLIHLLTFNGPNLNSPTGLYDFADCILHIQTHALLTFVRAVGCLVQQLCNTKLSTNRVNIVYL